MKKEIINALLFHRIMEHISIVLDNKMNEYSNIYCYQGKGDAIIEQIDVEEEFGELCKFTSKDLALIEKMIDAQKNITPFKNEEREITHIFLEKEEYDIISISYFVRNKIN